MLTIKFNIEDEQLAQRLVEKAETHGKTVDELVKELVDDQYASTGELDFDYPRLDVREHMEVIQEKLTEEEERILAKNPDVRPYSHIKDPAQYIHDLRRKPRF